MITIAVIGTGNMGAPMSINLARAGHRVQAFDIVADKMQPLLADGVIATESHQQALANADIVLTMLPTGIEVKDVYFNQILPWASTKSVLIDSSTIDIEDARAVHDKTAEAGFKMIDAPVSGGTAGAAAGKLTFMVGGDQETMELAHSALEVMAGTIIHCGGPGMGQAAKMCNNMMLGIQMASVVEGFHLAKKLGLSDQKLYEVSSSSSANCFSLSAFCPVPEVVDVAPANNDYQPGFATDLMLKDMGLALNAAQLNNLNLDLAPVAARLYQSFSDQGNGGLDFSAIYKMLE
jgi:3-hydroxyisobutyrate dehydrogenase